MKLKLRYVDAHASFRILVYLRGIHIMYNVDDE
jgi:hypothetical protein